MVARRPSTVLILAVVVMPVIGTACVSRPSDAAAGIRVARARRCRAE